MYEVAKLDFWGDPEQATCDLAGENGEGEELFDIYVGEVELMQYTGLKDKNGTEIYEGDILKVKMYSGEYENYKVEWDKKYAEFEAYNKDKSNFIIARVWSEYEIIGNIFENPELMEDS